MAQNKMFLQTSDGKTFEIEKTAAQQCGTINRMITDGYVNGNIPVPNITGETCVKIIKYCERHAAADAIPNLEDEKIIELNMFDTEFINLDPKLLFELMFAAKYLEINSLMHLSCKKVADMMKSKSAEEIRSMFNIENDFTYEEEQEIRKENAWAFE